ncbi:MAG: hypothetical protein CVT48_04840, partial [Thermoplasmata archaeon HGW-Thermoplasmata-1]
MGKNTGNVSRHIALVMSLMMLSSVFAGVVLAQDIPSPMDVYGNEPTEDLIFGADTGFGTAIPLLEEAQGIIGATLDEDLRIELQTQLEALYDAAMGVDPAVSCEDIIWQIDELLETVQSTANIGFDLMPSEIPSDSEGGMTGTPGYEYWLDVQEKFNNDFDKNQSLLIGTLTLVLVENETVQNVFGEFNNGKQTVVNQLFEGDTGAYAVAGMLIDGAIDASEMAFGILILLAESGEETATTNLLSDFDLDGIPDIDEICIYIIYGLDPTKFDTDGDDYDDGMELARGTDPTEKNPYTDVDVDPDCDGYTTNEEYAAGSDPYNWKSTPEDYDGDGIVHAVDRFETVFKPENAPNLAVDVSKINSKDTVNDKGALTTIWFTTKPDNITIDIDTSTKNYPLDVIEKAEVKLSWVNDSGSQSETYLAFYVNNAISKDTYPNYEPKVDEHWQFTLTFNEIYTLVGEDNVVTVEVTVNDIDETKITRDAEMGSFAFHTILTKPAVNINSPADNIPVANIGDSVSISATITGDSYNPITYRNASVLGTDGEWISVPLTVNKDDSTLYGGSWTVTKMSAGIAKVYVNATAEDGQYHNISRDIWINHKPTISSYNVTDWQGNNVSKDSDVNGTVHFRVAAENISDAGLGKNVGESIQKVVVTILYYDDFGGAILEEGTPTPHEMTLDNGNYTFDWDTTAEYNDYDYEGFYTWHAFYIIAYDQNNTGVPTGEVTVYTHNSDSPSESAEGMVTDAPGMAEEAAAEIVATVTETAGNASEAITTLKKDVIDPAIETISNAAGENASEIIKLVKKQVNYTTDTAYALADNATTASEDADGDGYSNERELNAGSNPFDPHSTPSDLDGDGLTNKEEREIGSNENLKDSDGDGLNDYEEVYVYETDPTKADTDGDGIWDSVEILVLNERFEQGSDPNNKDSPVPGGLGLDNRILVLYYEYIAEGALGSVPIENPDTGETIYTIYLPPANTVIDPTTVSILVWNIISGEYEPVGEIPPLPSEIEGAINAIMENLSGIQPMVDETAAAAMENVTGAMETALATVEALNQSIMENLSGIEGTI